MKKGSTRYPVCFQPSNTSGEKPYEEFYTETETIDRDRFHSLGVITGKEICDKAGLDKLFGELEALFAKDNVEKADVVAIIDEYLPNFRHIETGKSLDEKM